MNTQQLNLFATTDHAARQLREAAGHYLDLDTLARIAAEGGDIWSALRGSDAPAELKDALRLLQALLTPPTYTQLTSPTDVAAFLMARMAGLVQEEFWVINLDTKNRILSISRLYVGCLNSCPVRAAEVFREAIQLGAAAVILAHGHPSGDPTPSADDVIVTRQLVQAGQLLDVETLDHLVIGAGRFVSMRERRLGWN